MNNVKKEDPSLDEMFLGHIKNISGRNIKCAYFGRMYSEPREANARCLAVEQLPDHVYGKCPFYKQGLENHCNYAWNIKYKK